MIRSIQKKVALKLTLYKMSWVDADDVLRVEPDSSELINIWWQWIIIVLFLLYCN